MRIQLSSCAIINDREEMLLLWKKKRQQWELPGWKVKAGENLREAAIRESQEEVGVLVTLKEYLWFENFEIDNRFFQSHKFLGVIEDEQVPRVNEPDVFEEMSWLPIKNYQDYICASSVWEFCKKYLKRKMEMVLN